MSSRRESCEVERLGFIGYAAHRDVTAGRDVVRIFINCEPTDAPTVNERQRVSEPAGLRPPDDIRFLHAVDVLIEEQRCRFSGLDTLSSIRKFHRFMGALGERAREMGRGQDWPYESTTNLLETLARIKNSRDFTSTPSAPPNP
jgi:hypothetical protein